MVAKQPTIKTRPILFSRAMVEAILNNKKTQTRRLVIPRQSEPKVPPVAMFPWIIDGEVQEYDDGRPLWVGTHPDYAGDGKWFACDYGQPGERLWVREAMRRNDAGVWHYEAGGQPVLVAEADRSAMIVWAHHKEGSYHSPRFMPRWACRLTLEITEIRVERVQDISEREAQSEGWDCSNIDPMKAYDPVRQPDKAREWFQALWETINGPRGYGWAANNWVWVIGFKVVAPC